MLRSAVLQFHRWFGLVGGGLLLMTALTGAVLPWQHELDAWLNPALFAVPERGAALPAQDLVRRIETAHPEARVSYVPLVYEPGHALVFSVEPSPDAVSGTTPALDFDQVFMNPVTGAELGTRHWGELWPLQRENLLPLTYLLHYTLLMPGVWGTWLLGGVALLWLVDCFAGLYLTLPPVRRSNGTGAAGQRSGWQRWGAAWRIRLVHGFRLLFDLHRAPALWTWLLLLMLAFSSAALNLYGELFHPALARVAELTPTPYDEREPGAQWRNRQPESDFAGIVATARADGLARGWVLGPGDVYHARSYGFYRLKFFDAAHPEGDSALGPAMLFYDDVDHRLVGSIEPGVGTVGDLVIELQFPLHSGLILGFTGRVLISLLGVVLSLLIVTGILIWARKARARAAGLALPR